jgi:hypothetical protein
MRISCPDCGGWIDQGIDAASWPVRQAAFNKTHAHPAGAPIVYRWAGTNADRNAWGAAVDAAGLVQHGFAPIGRAAVAHVSKGAAAPLRVVADSAASLAAALATLT